MHFISTVIGGFIGGISGVMFLVMAPALVPLMTGPPKGMPMNYNQSCNAGPCSVQNPLARVHYLSAAQDNAQFLPPRPQLDGTPFFEPRPYSTEAAPCALPTSGRPVNITIINR